MMSPTEWVYGVWLEIIKMEGQAGLDTLGMCGDCSRFLASCPLGVQDVPMGPYRTQCFGICWDTSAMSIGGLTCAVKRHDADVLLGEQMVENVIVVDLGREI